MPTVQIAEGFNYDFDPTLSEEQRNDFIKDTMDRYAAMFPNSTEITLV